MRLTGWIVTIMVFAGTPVMASPQAGDIVTERGVARSIDGADLPYEVGTLYVPENRDKPASRLIGVGFVRLKAAKPTGAPPVFILAGGPGVLMLDTLTAMDDASKRLIGTWINYTAVADIVIIEQRGYTLRGDRLILPQPAAPLDRPYSVGDYEQAILDAARHAPAAYPDHDLSGYSITNIADDANDLRRALGYDHMSLLGASFGSQWAFAIMRRHPEQVSRAVLSAVEPLDDGYDMPSQVYAVLQRIAFEADQDSGLKPYLPEGGLMAAIQAVHNRLATQPVTVAVDKGTIVLGVGDFEDALLSRVNNATSWPAFVLSLYHGHYDDWARDAIAGRQPGSLTLIGPLIDTGLGVSPARRHQLETDPAIAWLGRWNFSAYLGATDIWQTPDAGDTFRLPVVNDIPVVFVQGDWDASTPMDNTLSIAPWFRWSHTLLVHRGQHNGAIRLLRDDPAAQAAVFDFLRTGNTDNLPIATSLKAVPFAIPAFPAPAKATVAS